MLTGQIRNDIDKLWDKFWSGGITTPLTVIEQISYLMFARMLDMQEDMAERARALQQQGEGSEDFTCLFPNTQEGQQLRWKNFKQKSGADLHTHLKDNVFPYFAKLGKRSDEQEGLGSTGSPLEALGHISEFMQDAELEIENESVLACAVEMVDRLPLGQSGQKGAIYEHLLSKLTTAGINSQFRTPRHIIDAVIELVDPQPYETVCDPACGTAGFLVHTMEYLNRTHSSEAGIIENEDGYKHYTGDLLAAYRDHINQQMFWGFDFDTTMLCISSMNMALHGVNGANIFYQDSLSQSIKEHFPQQEENFFDVILSNPPFKGSLDETNTNPDVLSLVKTKKTELLFVAHILRSLKPGGRAAIIVTDSVLVGSSKAHQQLRQELIENNQLEGIVRLPSGVFKPYTGANTAILMFSKGGTTERVWFYNLQADGYSLNDKRTPLKGEENNDLPDVIENWKAYRNVLENEGRIDESSSDKNSAPYAPWLDKTQKAFVVDAADIASNHFDLSINRYKEEAYKEEKFEDPKVILNKLKTLENEILQDLNELEKML